VVEKSSRERVLVVKSGLHASVAHLVVKHVSGAGGGVVAEARKSDTHVDTSS
jgi:hypothetical protein